MPRMRRPDSLAVVGAARVFFHVRIPFAFFESCAAHTYPLMLPAFTTVLLILLLLHMFKANAQLILASTLLWLWRMMT